MGAVVRAGARWGVEGASGLGRHTATYLVGRGHDVRDCCATRTAERARQRRQGKTDALDAQRIAWETLADPDMPVAFKRAPGDAGPDETTQLLSLWHNARRSPLKSRQHLLSEAESLLVLHPALKISTRRVAMPTASAATLVLLVVSASKGGPYNLPLHGKVYAPSPSRIHSTQVECGHANRGAG